MEPQRAVCSWRLPRNTGCRCISLASVKAPRICAPSSPRISPRALLDSRIDTPPHPPAARLIAAEHATGMFGPSVRGTLGRRQAPSPQRGEGWVRGLLFALAILLGCLRPADAAEMLVLSDIHFDPTANKALVDRLAAAEPAQWVSIFATDDTRMSTYREDTNWKLLRSTLAATKAPKPDFVLVSGDFLVHQFRTRF